MNFSNKKKNITAWGELNKKYRYIICTLMIIGLLMGSIGISICYLELIPGIIIVAIGSVILLLTTIVWLVHSWLNRKNL